MLDLTKPVLSLRKEAKEDLDQSVNSTMMQYYTKMVSKKQTLEKLNNKARKIRSSMNKNRVHTTMPSYKQSVAAASQNSKGRTREERFRLNAEDVKSEQPLNHSKSRAKEKQKSPRNFRPNSKEKPLILSRIDEKRPSLRVRKRRIQTGSGFSKKANKDEQPLPANKTEEKSTSKPRQTPSRSK